MKSPAGLIRHAIEHEGYRATTLAPVFLARVLPHLSGNLDICSDDLLDPQEA